MRDYTTCTTPTKLTCEVVNTTSTKNKISYMSCLPKMIFSHISYTYLAEDRVECWKMDKICQKCCPILQIFT